MARRSALKKLRAAARNAADLLRHGRLGAPWAAPHEIVDRGPHHQLRRYHAAADGPLAGVAEPLLLVPPLMVTAEVYDISPELSSVAFLASLGLDVWLVDFGVPEAVDGGLARTLDDHVLAIDRSVDRVRAETGHDVHLGGYSQGGMFCYQVAAWRKSAGVASIVTFGSPVDIHRLLPVKVADPLVDRVLRWVRAGIDQPLGDLEGLPGAITSTGFKVFAARKELQQIATFFRLLHDREALEKREPTRRFLGGEGFVAWPGPAFKDFVDRVIVENRMARGGLIIGGRTVGLADITVPILSFVGLRDEMARPPAVRAIRRAAPRAEVHEVALPAGHFGLVVGSRALSVTWPTTAEWVAWRAGVGDKPAALDQPAADGEEEAPGDAQGLYEVSVQALDGLWNRLGKRSVEAAGLLHALRWEIPRMARLESLRATDRVGLGRTLREQARAIPDAPFLVWQDRPFSWAEVDARVDRMVDALVATGVVPGDEVRVPMGPHPDHLTAVVALDRLGAVAVVTPDGEGIDVGALARAEAPRADVPRDEGRGYEPAMVLDGAVITHRRWTVAALATAAACQLSPRDTVLCALPLHHPLALLVAGGGALVGGTRLALADGAEDFWAAARRTGATVAVYDGSLLRELVAAPARRGEDRHPLRLLVGSGADAETWTAFRARFGGVRLLEFHASAVGSAVLANLEGTKPGSVGRPFPGSAWITLVRAGNEGQLLRGPDGRLQRCDPDEPGVLLVRIEAGRSLGVEAVEDPEVRDAQIVRDALEPGDAWIVTGDRLRRDAEGDWWRA